MRPTIGVLLLLRVLSEGPATKDYLLSTLQDELGVKKERTLRRYLGTLREAGFEISRSRGRYELRASPVRLAFTNHEALATLNVVESLAERDPVYGEHLASASLKLREALPKEALRFADSGRVNTLRFLTEEGKRFVPVETTSELHVFGEVEFNTRLLNFLSQNHIPLHIYNYYGYWAGSYMPREQYVSGHLTLRQAEHYLDTGRRIVLARTFVWGALANMERVLGYYNRRGSDLGEAVGDFAVRKTLVEEQATPGELMALEGNSRELYYKSWDAILKCEDFRFGQRTRRPPMNRVNALVSFGNSLMYVTVLSEIHRTHLDPRIGFLHTTNQRRYTLNLDVAEIFKPIIVDRIIFTLINRGALQAKDFRNSAEGVFLSEKGRKTFLEAYETRLKETIQHPKLNRSVSYRRLIRMELYKLEKHLLGDESYEPYVSRW